jgi:pyrimidine-specific ribonucleoside hydrolase
MRTTKIPIVWDMETGDPDDLFTLFLLCGHPNADLKAVNVVPGAPDQIGLVRQVLAWFDLDIPVGAFNIGNEKPVVSDWYYEVYGSFAPSHDAEPGHAIIRDYCTPGTTLITGGPLRNLATAIRLAEQDGDTLSLDRWVGQGGFAGEGVVPPERQLPQFKGWKTAPTTNFNKHSSSAKRVLAHQGIREKRLVSKNVCHGVYYDQAMHDRFAAFKDASLSHRLIWQGMDVYLQKHPAGKKFHDPLAACCALDEAVGVWAEVEVYRAKGEWGSHLSPGSGTWITIDYDHARFVETLTMV